MIEKTELIIRIVFILVGALAAGVPSLVGLFTVLKKKTNANNEATEGNAELELREYAEAAIMNAEKMFNGVSLALKASGDSAGAIKKDSVLAKLQTFAINKGYTFDVEYWSKKIDEIISFTKAVNAKA